MTPVVALYSTFLQRSYDQILQDVAMLKLPVVLAVDRAGLVGEDGETHHGIFDVGFLRQAPGMTVLCPASCAELEDMLQWAVEDQSGPVAIRYPRGGDREYTGSAFGEGLAYCHRTGTDITIITYGTLVNNALEAARLLEESGISAGVVRLLSVSALPVDALLELLPGDRPVFIMEEAAGNAGIRDTLAWQLHRKRPNIRVAGVDLGYGYVTHGSVGQLYECYGLDCRSVADKIQEVLKVEN
jgi:1-deoxy-D-xylulose-5-phosphate synthase